MEKYVHTVFGDRRVDQIGREDVLRVLTPIWTAKPEVARKVRQRIRASERTSVPHAVCEMALAHRVGSDVERSYARSDLFEKRCALMASWAAYVTSADRNVVRLPAG